MTDETNRPAEQRCNNWPCALPAGHDGPCNSVYDRPSKTEVCHFYPAEKCPDIGVSCRENGYCPRQHAMLPEVVPSNLQIGPRCAESNGWPVYRDEKHVATFSEESDARDFVRRASETPAVASNEQTALLNAADDLGIAVERECWEDVQTVIAYMREAASRSSPETNGDREARLVAALAMMYDKYEDGTPCYEDPEDFTGFLGNAIKLTDAEDQEVLSLIPQHRSPEKTNCDVGVPMDKREHQPPICETCGTLLAFDGDVCGLCNPVAQP